MNCKACESPNLNWNSVCPQCNYYQHSCMSAEMFNFLKVEGNAELLYSKILDKEELK